MPELLNISATPDARFQPWRESISIQGEEFRRKEVLGFADAVAKAAESQAEFGVRLDLDPDNPTNPDSVVVVGYTRAKLVPAESSFQLGFLASTVAAELAVLAESGQEFAAKLRAIEFANEGGSTGDEPINVVIDLYVAPRAAQPG